MMKRTQTSLRRMSETRATDVVPGTPEQRIALVWSLTCEVLSLSNRYDAERRLERHVTRLIRRKG